MLDDEAIFAIARENRLLAADLLAGLSEEQWRYPSLCEGWTVREVAAHLVPPKHMNVFTLAPKILRYRGDLERMVDETTRRDARRPTGEIVELLRERAGARLKPPVTGAGGPMSDSAIHLRDIAQPLGLPVTPEPHAWGATLDFLVSVPATKGYIPQDRVPGLRLVATDDDWTHGEGADLTGTAEALAMAVSGRAIYLPELEGAGVSLLRDRLGNAPA